MRFLGARQGIAVTGILGGIASSTAATFGLSHQARSAGESLARYFALGITIASTIMFVRVYIITAVIDAPLARALALPIALPFSGRHRNLHLSLEAKDSEGEAALHVKNPMELWSAIKFGLMFAVVMFVSKAGYEYFGSSGMYVTGVLAGLVDPDAFTISAAHTGPVKHSCAQHGQCLHSRRLRHQHARQGRNRRMPGRASAQQGHHSNLCDLSRLHQSPSAFGWPGRTTLPR